jgi:TatD DNase family protein
MSLVDIGANLTNRRFAGDLDAVLARAHAAHVDTIVITGTTVEGSFAARDLAARRGAPVRLFATAGIHPHHAKTHGPLALASLRELCADPRVVAVGECGLDYDRNFSPPADQRACFAAQLALAAELGKPLFLHERAAHADFVAILREHRERIGRAVVHCFTGDAAELDRYLELGLEIGVTGWINDDRRGGHLRELVARIPAGRLMIETDAPYLTPRDVRPAPRGGRNEPALLTAVARAVARARGEDVEELARHTTETALGFFGIASP